MEVDVAVFADENMDEPGFDVDGVVVVVNESFFNISSVLERAESFGIWYLLSHVFMKPSIGCDDVARPNIFITSTASGLAFWRSLEPVKFSVKLQKNQITQYKWGIFSY